MLKLIPRTFKLHSYVLRKIHTGAFLRLREVIVQKPDEKTTVIDCKYIQSPREPYLLKLNPKSSKCPLCQLQLSLKYTDVLILSQYIDSQGNLLKQSDTNLCKDQYKLVSNLIYMAQYAGLLPEPPRNKKPYQLLNTYYDEKTINLRPTKTHRHLRYKYISDKLSPLEKARIKPHIGPYYGTKV